MRAICIFRRPLGVLSPGAGRILDIERDRDFQERRVTLADIDDDVAGASPDKSVAGDSRRRLDRFLPCDIAIGEFLPLIVADELAVLVNVEMESRHQAVQPFRWLATDGGNGR